MDTDCLNDNRMDQHDVECNHARLLMQCEHRFHRRAVSVSTKRMHSRT